MSSTETPGGIAPILATRVLDLVARGGHEVGFRLREQALADQLGVSRTPVRKALQYLAELGAVNSEPNRGFFVAQDQAKLRKISVPTDDDSEEAVYMRIAEDRLARRLADEVAESDLMDRYQLSRAQIQRILNRMGREGLADRKPGRGWIFRPVLNTVESHRESYRFRMVIEPAAIMEPTFKVDKAAFAKARRVQQQLLEGGIEKWTPAERFEAGAQLHETIVASSNNRFFLDSLRNLNQLRRVIEYHQHTKSSQDRTRLHRQCEEHLHLLDLLEAGERMEAYHELRKHLDVVNNIKTGLATESEAIGATVEIHL